ncbi:hypothetical protein AK812_SmicGene1094 [Symbiodinium microadriaticum]|uniref:Uncharacterized protein n=1 Tax=Symbiodinium microadriaticum TaxID=2951 RepID=A0A1Q9F4Z1_SYMMI|nr:hypothetical protein AK812_SmicGene1094 [Symbiodinium microadriaticum]
MWTAGYSCMMASLSVYANVQCWKVPTVTRVGYVWDEILVKETLPKKRKMEQTKSEEVGKSAEATVATTAARKEKKREKRPKKEPKIKFEQRPRKALDTPKRAEKQEGAKTAPKTAQEPAAAPPPPAEDLTELPADFKFPKGYPPPPPDAELPADFKFPKGYPPPPGEPNVNSSGASGAEATAVVAAVLAADTAGALPPGTAQAVVVPSAVAGGAPIVLSTRGTALEGKNPEEIAEALSAGLTGWCFVQDTVA